MSDERGAGADATVQFAKVLTPAYAAPEQILGEPVSTATDVYQLGVLLYKLLVGSHPYVLPVSSRHEIARMALETHPARMSDSVDRSGVCNDESAITRAGRRALRPDQLRKTLRGDLDAIVAKALRKKVSERYGSAAALAEDVRRYIRNELVLARSHSAGHSLRKFVARHRVAVAVTGLVLLSVLSSLAFALVQMSDAQAQRDRALSASRRAEASKEFLTLLFTTDLGPAYPMRTIYERLNSAVAMLERQYGDDPTFQGRMLVEMGTGFRDGDELRRAHELFQKGYDIGREHHDVELMALAQCSRAYGEGNADVREGVMERLHEAERLLGQIDHPNAEVRAGCLRARAAVAQRLGHSPEAEEFLLRAKRVMEADGSTRGTIYGSILTNLGGMYMARNQQREALRMMQLVGETYDRNGRGSTYNRFIARHNVAAVLSAMGETRAALAERKIIDGGLRELAGPMGPLNVKTNHAALLIRMGRAASALDTLDSTLERARKSGNSAQLTNTLFWRGSALVQLERWDEAKATLHEAAALAAAGIGNRYMGALVESAMARMELARGSLDGARGHRDRSLELAGYRTENTQRSLARVLLVAAQVTLAEGAAASAERFARDSLAISEPNARGPDTSDDVGEALLRLAQARIASGATADAKPLLERAVRCLANGLGPDHALTVEARQLLPGS